MRRKPRAHRLLQTNERTGDNFYTFKGTLHAGILRDWLADHVLHGERLAIAQCLAAGCQKPLLQVVEGRNDVNEDHGVGPASHTMPLHEQPKGQAAEVRGPAGDAAHLRLPGEPREVGHDPPRHCKGSVSAKLVFVVSGW